MTIGPNQILTNTIYNYLTLLYISNSIYIYIYVAVNNIDSESLKNENIIQWYPKLAYTALKDNTFRLLRTSHIFYLYNAHRFQDISCIFLLVYIFKFYKQRKLFNNILHYLIKYS